MLTKGKFATSVGCIDGRIQIPIIDFLEKEYGVDYVDIVTEPGMDAVIANLQNRVETQQTIRSIKNKIAVSVNAHGSQLICISSHYDCAGNPVTREEHIEMVKKCVKDLRGSFPSCSILGVWVDERWKINVIVPS